MAKLNELLRDLGRALEGGDLEQVASVRRTIVEAHEGTKEGAEAAYKLALDALFRQKDGDRAAELLRIAGKSKVEEWSLPARVSLGLLLLRQGKHQQAAFELRKVAALKPPTLLTAQAQGFLVMALYEQKNGKEAQRIRGEQLKTLGGLTQSQEPTEAAMAHLLLGLEHKFDGQRADAKKHLHAAVESGRLPKDELAMAQAALAEV